jgi:hypothetical protein
VRRRVRLSAAVAASAVLAAGAGVALGSIHTKARPNSPQVSTSADDAAQLTGLRAELDASARRAALLRAAIARAGAEVRLRSDANRASGPGGVAPPMSAAASVQPGSRRSITSRAASARPRHSDSPRPTPRPSRSDDDGSGGGGEPDG